VLNRGESIAKVAIYVKKKMRIARRFGRAEFLFSDEAWKRGTKRLAEARQKQWKKLIVNSR
jgi:hypothetical protein